MQYISWGNYSYNIYIFAKEAARKKDVFEYFKDIKNIPVFKSINLADIGVRFKEQKLKAKIIDGNKLSYDFFDNLESKAPTRKIQYLLYIAGYWTKNNPNYAKLLKYKKTAETYFMSKDNLLEHREYFAVATYLDLLDKKDFIKIDTNSCNNNHIWDDTYYFWNDSANINEGKLDILEIAYENFDKITTYINNFGDTNINTYDACWLKYAVMHKTPDGLTLNLSKENNMLMIEYSKGKTMPLGMFMLMKKSNLYYGQYNFTKSYNEEFKFEAGISYKLNGKDIIYRPNNALTIKIEHDVKITTNVNSYHKGYTLYSFDNIEYKVYEVDLKNQYKFNEYIYDFTAVQGTFEAEKAKWESFFESYKGNRDEFLTIWANKQDQNCTWKTKQNSRSTYIPDSNIATIQNNFNGKATGAQISL